MTMTDTQRVAAKAWFDQWAADLLANASGMVKDQAQDFLAKHEDEIIDGVGNADDPSAWLKKWADDEIAKHSIFTRGIYRSFCDTHVAEIVAGIASAVGSTT